MTRSVALSPRVCNKSNDEPHEKPAEGSDHRSGDTYFQDCDQRRRRIGHQANNESGHAADKSDHQAANYGFAYGRPQAAHAR